MSEYTSSSYSDPGNLAFGLVSVSATAAKEALVLGLTFVCAIMWISLTAESCQNQGLVEGVIIGIYSLAPVVFIIGWPLQEHSKLRLPTFVDLVGVGGDGDEEPASTGEVEGR